MTHQYIKRKALKNKSILIAGGGIGGLSAAAGLAQKGFKSIVFESAPELSEIGAGIQLGPNAFHCFDYLGVGNTARKNAIYIDALKLMDAITGKDIANIPLDDTFRKRMGNPYAVVHRADMHKALLDYCLKSRLITVKTNHTVERYEHGTSDVMLYIKDKKPVKGSVLIGAEGLRSNIRQQLIGDGEPNISGHSTYRSVIPTEQMPKELRWNAATLWAGPKCHIVHYPLKGWKFFNLVVTYHRNAKEAIAGQSVSKEEVMKGFEHLAPIARKIIENGKDWKLWVLCDRDPINNWVDKRVTLLGDAAHPVLQYLAHGACMAMEEAVCLAACLDNYRDDEEMALQKYQSLRIVRTARVQLGSRLIGEYIYHPDGVIAQVRNQAISDLTPEQWCDRLEWLYGKNIFLNGLTV